MVGSHDPGAADGRAWVRVTVGQIPDASLTAVATALSTASSVPPTWR